MQAPGHLFTKPYHLSVCHLPLTSLPRHYPLTILFVTLLTPKNNNTILNNHTYSSHHLLFTFCFVFTPPYKFSIKLYVRTYVKRDVRRIMLAPMLELMLGPMLRDMLELMLELMLGGMLEGGQSPVLPPTTSHFLFVLGLLLLLLPYPTVTTSTSTVSVLAFTPLPFGRPTFKVPAARFSFNSLIRC